MTHEITMRDIIKRIFDTREKKHGKLTVTPEFRRKLVSNLKHINRFKSLADILMAWDCYIEAVEVYLVRSKHTPSLFCTQIDEWIDKAKIKKASERKDTFDYES